MIRITAPTRAQRRQSEMNSEDELVVVEVWLVDDESWASAGDDIATRAAAKTTFAA